MSADSGNSYINDNQKAEYNWLQCVKKKLL